MEPNKGKRSLKYKSMEEEGEEEEEEEEEDDDVVSGEGFAGDATTLTRKKRPAMASGSSATVAASSTTSTGGSTARRGGSSAGGSTRPSCQADNCSVDLTDSRHYHRRHKICEYHAKATVVTVNGLQQRFCQQCSRFHGLSEFDDNKRSCRRRLAGHNERRRKGSSDLHREGSN